VAIVSLMALSLLSARRARAWTGVSRRQGARAIAVVRRHYPAAARELAHAGAALPRATTCAADSTR